MYSLKKITLLILLHFATLPAVSQNKKDTVIKINEVKIIEKRPEKNLFLSDSSVITENKNLFLSDLLNENSGIFIKSYGNGSLATISLRGTSASHTKILRDGVSLNSPMTGQADLSLIPVFFFENIELLKGLNSETSCSGALGGSIILNTETEIPEKISVSLIQTAASFDTYQSFLKISGGKKKLKTSFKILGEKSKNDFEFLNTANGDSVLQKQTNADYRKYAFGNTTIINLSDNKKLILNGDILLSDRNIPPLMTFSGKDRNENQKDENTGIYLKYKSKKNKIKTEISGAFLNQKLNYFSGININDTKYVIINSESLTKRFFGRYKNEISLRNTKILTEITGEYQNASYTDLKSGITFNPERKIAEISAFADKKIGKKTNAFAVGRINLTDGNFIPPIFSGGIKYFAEKYPLRLKFSAGQNFRNPSLNDLYRIPGGNPDLKPEKSVSGEINANYRLKTGNIELLTDISIYISKINNRIIWQPTDFYYMKAENIEKVLSRGADFSFSGQFKTKKTKTSFKINYTFVKTTNISEQSVFNNSYDKQLMYVPVHKAVFSLPFSFSGYFLKISDIFVSERFTTSSNEDYRHKLPAYNLVNLKTGKTFDTKKIKLTVEFEAKNIFDVSYNEILWRPVPGRYFIFGLKLNNKIK